MPPKKASGRRASKRLASPSKGKDTVTRPSTSGSRAAEAISNPSEPAKRRGRPPKTATPSSKVESKSKTNKRKREDDEPATTSEPPKKRGRPAKNDAVAVTPSKRGRPAKGAVKQEESTATKPAKKSAPAAKTTSPAKRGRPAKTEARTEAPAPAKKRGRPAASDASAPAAKKGRPVKTSATVAPAKKKMGRPAKSTSIATQKRRPLAKKAEREESPEVAPLVEDEEESDVQYWLMKAEPDTRIVKGIDVAFSIDKLAQATEPEPWDGVRNPVARNHMRTMRKGDLAFFYHSNCATPAIVGAMRVAEEHDVDQSAFDATHPYFDEKSDPAKPKWDCVKVEFVKKFVKPVTLRDLKATPELVNMQIAQNAYGRLSVQKVTSAQWRFVLGMAEESEDLGVISAVSGYEADTNGETDNEAVAALPKSPNPEIPQAEILKLDAYGSPDLSDDEIEDNDAPAAQLQAEEPTESAADNRNGEDEVMKDIA